MRALLGRVAHLRVLTPPAAAAAPVTAGLPFVDSPTGLILCLAFYFVVVGLGFALQSGATPTTKRADPAWLRAIVLLHNLFLVVLSLYMCAGCASRRAAGRRSCRDPHTARKPRRRVAAGARAPGPDRARRSHLAWQLSTRARRLAAQRGVLRARGALHRLGQPVQGQRARHGHHDLHLLRQQDLRVHGHLHHAAQGQPAPGAGRCLA